MDKEGDAASTSLPTFLIHALNQLLRLKSSVAEAQTLHGEHTKNTNSREFAGRVNKLIINLKGSINTIERSFTTSYEAFLSAEASSHVVANAKALNHEHSYALLPPKPIKKTPAISEKAAILRTALKKTGNSKIAKKIPPVTSKTVEETFPVDLETVEDTSSANSEIAEETPSANSETAEITPVNSKTTEQTTTNLEIVEEAPATNSEIAEETPRANSETDEETLTTKTVSSKRANGDVQSKPIKFSKTVNSDIVSNEETVSVMRNETEKSASSSEQPEIKSEMDDSEAEPPKRCFIKCIDITKLLDPTKVPIPKTPEVVNGSRPANDSIICLSSESDTDKKKTLKKTLKKKNTAEKKGKKIEAQVKKDDSDSDVPIAARIRQRNKPNFEQLKKLRQSRLAKKRIRYTSSSSSSSSVSDNEKSDSESEKEKTAPARKAPVVDYDYRSDQKFTQRCTVSLVRVPVEQLKHFCLEQTEEVEVQRLSTMKSLKRTRPEEESPVEIPEEEAVTKAQKKRSKLQLAQQNKKKNSHDSNSSDAESTNGLPEEIANEEETVTALTENAKDVLASSDSNNDELSDHSNKASDTNIVKKNKKQKCPENEEKKEEEKPTDEEKKNTSSDDQEKSKAKEKSKWKNDSLLKKKLDASDDSEDELLRFRNKREALAKEIRRSTKKQLKKIARRLDSDDSSEDDDKEDEKRSSSAELFQEKKSDEEKKSSSGSEEEEEDEDKKKPVRKRIKRIKDSDESSNAEGEEGEGAKKSGDGKSIEDSTRKKIRHVWNERCLADSTKAAAKEEEARKKRIADRQKMYNDIYVKSLDANAKVDKVVLDFNEESKEELLAVHPDLVAKLKPHQGKGVQFMWTACFESLERAQKTEGSGCILAHCMGLGKTLQVITLIHTLLINSEKTNVNTVLVVCPLSTVLNWVSEFKMWLDDLEGDQVNVFDLVQYKNAHERLYQMKDWMKHGGVMVMGYDMFRNLSNPKGKRMSKKLVAGFNKVLLEPGPDLVVCDEGHLLKNEKTGISIAMNRLKTKRRIVLTGTPLQNNLKEYFCMVQFVKPSLLGTYKEYLNRFVNPITNGQYTDSTPHDIQIMRRRAHVLHKMLDAVVERRDYNVLAPFLPPKHEYVLFITLTDVQVQLYQEYLQRFARNPQIKGTSYLFQDFQELQRICIHPRVLLDKSNQDKLRKEYEDDESEGSLKDFIDDDESEKSTSTNASSSEESDDDNSSSKSKKKCAKKPATRRTRANPGAEEELISLEEPANREAGEWWSKYCENDELENIKYGTKIRLLFEILQQSELIGDKILVFSQSLFSLNLIEYFLARVDEATQNGDSKMLAQCGGNPGSWALGLDYFRLDGSTSCEQRAQWCKTFNSETNTRARLFLISTRAGGLGINLVAANRVIIFDVSWNPSHDVQSIYRVYRFGQIKPCYVYRFVTYGTMEHKIYERQVTKQAISKRVIDEQQIDRHYNQTDLSELYQFNAVPDEERPVPLVPKDRLFADLLQSHDKDIFKYHEHNSLLENKEEEGLNEEERKAAWEEFENEKTAPKFNLMQTMVRNGMYETLRLLVQQDNNSWTPAQVNQILPSIVQRISEQVARGDYNMYRRVEERHEMRVREQRRTQFIYQQYMQQIRAANATNPMNTAELNRLAQTLSMFAQPQMGQMQPNPYATQQQQQPGASSGVSFALDEPPPPAFSFPFPSEPRPHPTISEVVELND